jgi:hypothetical protein
VQHCRLPWLLLLGSLLQWCASAALRLLLL